VNTSTSPKSGFVGFLVLCVLVGSLLAFYIGPELLAFLIVSIATFIMLACGVAVLVLINNRQADESERNRQ